MNRLTTTTVVLLTILSGGCAHTPRTDAPIVHVSQDYDATGDASGIYPVIYGKRTLIRFSSAPWNLSISDENGVPVAYSKEGEYYKLARKLDRFTLSTGGRTVIFTRVIQDTPAIAPKDSTAENTQETAVELKAEHDIAPSGHDEPIFDLMKKQLARYRELLQEAEQDARAPGKELQAIHAKLTELERKMSIGVAVVHVHFLEGAVKPIDDEALDSVIRAARNAAQIKIYGRSSAAVPGGKDSEIAKARAVSVRNMLVASGIDTAKTHTYSLPSGDFIVAQGLNVADAYNRRVAIELIFDHD